MMLQVRISSFALVFALTGLGGLAWGQSAQAPDASFEALQAARFNELISRLARENVPHTFEDTSDWGMTDTRWDGLHVERDGLRITTKRRRKEVNHGDWKMYSCELVDPQNAFQISVHDVRVDSDEHARFDVTVDAQLKVHGRVSKWVKGVQLYSISADANAKVRITMSCQVAVDFEFVNFPPDILLNLDVDAAELELQQFDVYSVSKLGGETAQQLGRAMRHILEKKLEEKRDRLIAKINHKIDERQDDLRLSFVETDE